MTPDPPERRSRWPIIAVIASIAVLIVTLVAGVHFSGTSGTSGDAEPTSVDTLDVMIDIIDYKYVPPNISVPRGAEVTWVNDDEVQHTATEKNSTAWDTQVIHEGTGVRITFSAPGTYQYFCTIHPYMTGTITVR